MWLMEFEKIERKILRMRIFASDLWSNLKMDIMNSSQKYEETGNYQHSIEKTPHQTGTP